MHSHLTAVFMYISPIYFTDILSSLTCSLLVYAHDFCPVQVIVVSEEFEGKPLLARHRMVNALFAEEMKGKMHGENQRLHKSHQSTKYQLSFVFHGVSLAYSSS